jgi:hypothetical protein
MLVTRRMSAAHICPMQDLSLRVPAESGQPEVSVRIRRVVEELGEWPWEGRERESSHRIIIPSQGFQNMRHLHSHLLQLQAFSNCNVTVFAFSTGTTVIAFSMTTFNPVHPFLSLSDPNLNHQSLHSFLFWRDPSPDRSARVSGLLSLI